jgi:hypothetical protein
MPHAHKTEEDREFHQIEKVHINDCGGFLRRNKKPDPLAGGCD